MSIFREDGDVRTIEGFQGDEIYISQDRSWKGKKLVIKDCPNLEIFDAGGCLLKSVTFEGDCSKLEDLSLYNNQLTSLNCSNLTNLRDLNVSQNKLTSLKLSDCKNLVNLNCANNELRQLDLTNNTKLTYLNCAYNSLIYLEVTDLNDLKKLFCENNFIEVLDCSNLTKLEELNCSGQIRFFSNFVNGFRKLASGMNLLIVDNCKSLWFLDCAENNFTSLSLKNLPSLRIFSCKTNNISTLKVQGCPNLDSLFFSMQGEIVWKEGEEWPSIIQRKDNKPTTLLINDYN